MSKKKPRRRPAQQPPPALDTGTTVVASAAAHLPGVDPMTQLVITAVNPDGTLELAVLNGHRQFHHVAARHVFPA